MTSRAGLNNYICYTARDRTVSGDRMSERMKQWPVVCKVEREWDQGKPQWSDETR
jgi:hypothetical protein